MTKKVKIEIKTKDVDINVHIPSEELFHLGDILTNLQRFIAQEEEPKDVALEVQRQVLETLEPDRKLVPLGDNLILDSSSKTHTKVVRYVCDHCGKYSFKKMEISESETTTDTCSYCKHEVVIESLYDLVECKYECSSCYSTGYFLTSSNSPSAFEVKCVNCRDSVYLSKSESGNEYTSSY